MKRVVLALSALAATFAVAAAAVIYGGLYDISATDQHLAPTYRILDTAMRRSIARRAVEIVVPPLDAPPMLERGLALYDAHCVQCHGGPGIAPEPFALGLTPAPANLAHTAREWPAAEIYWVVRNGIKMTGMPAWQFRLAEADLWAVVAFVEKLPELSPRDYDELTEARAPPPHKEMPVRHESDPERGKTAMQQYACVTCHRIPGLVGPNAPVGPPLDGIGSRTYIAGVLRNEPDNMIHWLRAPQEVNAASAMPDLGVSEQDARDIAAYLATLD